MNILHTTQLVCEDGCGDAGLSKSENSRSLAVTLAGVIRVDRLVK